MTTKNNPLISIILPVYNVEPYLRQCLDSLVNQTYSNIEIISVNDGSTDRSLDILEEYAEKDLRMKVFSQVNGGGSAARNFALKQVNGEYLMFVDSDDWIDIETCQKAIEVSLSHNVDVVLWSYLREFESLSLPRLHFQASSYLNRVECRQLNRRMAGLFRDELVNPPVLDALGPLWGKLYRTSIVRDAAVELVDVKIVGTAEDALFNLEVFERIHSAYYLHETLYHYRKTNAGSLTSLYKPRLAEQWDELFRRMREVIERDRLGIEFHEALDNRISLSIIGLGLNVLNSDFSLLQKICSLDRLINRPAYRQTIHNLTLSYFPIHWRLLFFCAKYRLTPGLYLMLQGVRMMIGRG